MPIAISPYECVIIPYIDKKDNSILKNQKKYMIYLIKKIRSYTG